MSEPREPQLRLVLIVAGPAGAEADAASALATRGLRVVSVASGAEADALLLEVQPDLILVRDPLPDVETLAWISALRAGRARPVPIVFRSRQAPDVAAFKRLTRELGVDRVLSHSLPAALLADEVASLLPDPEPQASADAGLQQELAALRHEYGQALPGKLEQLSRAAHAARAHPLDLERVRELRRQAHVLRGTAGTFGFSVVSEAAGRIEDAAGRLLREPEASGAEQEIDLALRQAHGAFGPDG